MALSSLDDLTVEALVRRDRQAQGLPERVSDPETLERVARLIAGAKLADNSDKVA